MIDYSIILEKMATASVNPTEIPRNKLEDKMNTLREVIDSNKSMVLKVSEEMKQLIDEKSQLIIRELVAIWDEANRRLNQKREEVNEKIEKINEHKSKMKELFDSLPPVLPSFLEKIPEAIESVRREMNIEVPYVKLSWRVNELRKCIEGMCVCEDRVVKFGDDIPIALKWSSCDEGEQENQLYLPRGLSIDCINDRIYVADYNSNRVKIFSGNGEWIKDEFLINPENILTLHNSMFVQCCNNILKFNTSTFKRESHTHNQRTLSGICTDNTRIFVGEYNKMKLIELSLELKEEKRISLITDFKQNTTKIRDLSFARNEFYVLLTDTEYPIQSFSEQGSLTRCIVTRDILTDDVLYFCLDQQLNILVADRGSSRVKIFSNEGKLMTQIGKEGTAKGEFTYLMGIAVTELCSIITVDWKPQNMLQAFCYN